jgi:hypothetical protein
MPHNLLAPKWSFASTFSVMAITGLLGGSIAAAIMFETYARTRIRQNMARVHVYPVNETRTMDPSSAVSFEANCQSGDLPLTFTFATANLDLTLASPQILGATPNQKNGFTVLLLNSAEQGSPAQPVTVTTICFSRG